jgi:5-methylcytosine-specific restriction enzyme A
MKMKMNRHRFYDKYKRDPEARKFYKSKAWEKCRKIALQRDEFLCQSCLKNGNYTPADMVHHIKERKDYPELALDLDNLESLCNPCHNQMHSITSSNEQKTKVRRINVIKG